MATDLQNLVAIRSNIIATLAAEQVYAATHGPKLTYSLDGESYSWTEWEEAAARKIALLNTLIQNEQPYCIRSNVRL